MARPVISPVAPSLSLVLENAQIKFMSCIWVILSKGIRLLIRFGKVLESWFLWQICISNGFKICMFSCSSDPVSSTNCVPVNLL